jgi:dienelactone hydrolase
MIQRRYEGEIHVEAGGVVLSGHLTIPETPRGIVLFAHGSGSSRHSPRNRFVAGTLHGAAFATLLFDLLTVEEERIDLDTREFRFDIGLLAERLIGAVDWAVLHQRTRGLPIGVFGASTGAAAALIAAARRPGQVEAVVSRGGRPDLAGDSLPQVRAPVLLIVGGADPYVLELNRQAARQLDAPWEIDVVPGATHLFEEPGKLDQAARLATDWFTRHLTSSRSAEARP